jgi:hypothetical protein
MAKVPDPKKAVQNLVDLFAETDNREIPISRERGIADQIAYVASLPEAKGILKFDAERSVLMLLSLGKTND